MSHAAAGTTSGLHNPAVHVGAPAPDTQDDWVTTNVYVHGFADLPTSTDRVQSPNFFCFGYEWYLWVYPRGFNMSSETQEMISVYLVLSSAATITVDLHLVIDGFTGTNHKLTTFSFDKVKSTSVHGSQRFLTRELALTYLAKGALVFGVRMKRVERANIFIPDNPSTRLTTKDFFMDEECADVIFSIKWGLKYIKFYAHRMILKKAAPQLAELSLSDKSPSIIELPNVTPQTFNDLLRYIYGFKIPDLGKDISHTKDIIEVADKYGVTSLKLEAEVCYVSSLQLTLENVMDQFLFAEAKNCAFLKEKVIDFIINNSAEVMKQKKLTNVDGGPSMSDILAAVARGQAEKSTEKEFCTMSINELRHNAHKDGVDVDGSREMLVSALELSIVGEGGRRTRRRNDQNIS